MFMQRRIVLVISETAVNVASVGKLFYKTKRKILCQAVVTRVHESKNLSAIKKC